MYLGGGEPLPYLDAEAGTERIMVDLILDKLQDIRAKDRRDFFKRMEVAVQNGVAGAFKGS